MRLNKYLSDAGVCSRREADRLTEAGEIMVNGKRAETGMQVEPGDIVAVKGKTIVPEEKKVYLAFNKPRGIVCTAEKREKNNVIDYLSYPVRIYPVGRLDKDSEGLLLMTNDGAIVNGIMRARNRHEKEYQVEVNKEITPEFLKKMASGVPILDTVTRPCRIRKTGERSFTIILTQGLNRQIRRMCEHFGYEVKKLERTRIMNVSLSGIPLGEWRDLTDDELIDLFKLIENSSSEVKPKAKAKPKTAGIKRPVVKMEKTAEKGGRPASNGKRFTSPGRKKKGR